MVRSFLEKHKDTGILITRVGLGLAFLFIHGWNKLLSGPEMWQKIGSSMANFGITQYPVFWGFMASMSEFAGGILLVLGLFTRPASAFMAFTMLVAVVQHLTKLDPWSRVIYPLEMLSILVLFIFIGAGKYSLDNLLQKTKRSESRRSAIPVLENI